MAPHPALRRIVFIAIVLMLILMRREVEITAPAETQTNAQEP